MTAGLAGLAVAVLLAGAAAVALSGRSGARRRLSRHRSGQGQTGRAGPAWPAGNAGNAGRAGNVGQGVGDAGLAGGLGLRDPAMMLELIGAMLDAGAGLGRALELVAALAVQDIGVQLRPVVAALAIGADWQTAWRSSSNRSPQLLALQDALGFAALTGAPSSAILYAQAARIRRERFRTAERQAAALGVRLVVPLGLCSLPAFVCLGVVPVLLAMLPG